MTGSVFQRSERLFLGQCGAHHHSVHSRHSVQKIQVEQSTLTDVQVYHIPVLFENGYTGRTEGGGRGEYLKDFVNNPPILYCIL